jgi:hypothetical protein
MFVAKFKGADYIFSINGQTGKMSGNLPVDWSRAGSLFIKLALVTFIAAFLCLEVFLWLS